MESFGNKIKSLRLMLKYTQAELCQNLAEPPSLIESIEPSVLSRWENDRVTPTNRTKIAILDSLNSIDILYDKNILSTNVSKTAFEQKIKAKLYPDSARHTYYKNRCVTLLKSEKNIKEIINQGFLMNHTKLIDGDYLWLFDNFTLNELVDSYSLEILILEFDGQLMGHAITSMIPSKLIGKGKSYYSNLQFKLDEQGVKKDMPVFLVSSGLCPDLLFFNEVCAYLYKKNIESKDVRQTITLTKSHFPLWSELYTIYGAQALYEHRYQSNKSFVSKFQCFPIYEFLSNQLLNDNFLKNQEFLVNSKILGEDKNS